ncbi:PREDICTED: uncharacterized protein LOC108363507 [Rhagoletis zephyria]|uniref:uncharacterized protein LOC108363507 n=1 Tax=Rhagoletis zephyria TaxID=28612 RepID=UPI00081175EA|nr:PREDICTED: uncharacterized protein LOC108363507 [Rhagoletis zephyria]
MPNTTTDSGLSATTGTPPPAADTVAVVYARLPVPTISSTNIEAWLTTMDFWFTASGITTAKEKTDETNCQCAKIQRHTKSKPAMYEPPKERFRHIKPDINTCLAFLGYGTTLRIPGKFLEETKSKKVTTDTISQFQSTMMKLQPTQTKHHTTSKVFVSPALQSATHVFLRNDSIRPSLTQPYDGLFPVVKKSPKYFKLLVRGGPTNVRIDRLKPAFIASDESSDISTGARYDETYSQW